MREIQIQISIKMLITWNNSVRVVDGSWDCAAAEPWTEQWAEIGRVKQAVKQPGYLEQKSFYNTLKGTHSQPLVMGSDSNRENILVTTKNVCAHVCVRKQCKYVV